MASKAAVVGLAGLAMTAEEVALFRATPPTGVILFRRNIANPAQVLALTTQVRDVLGLQTPILVDQEGGRVARLRPPFWPAFPAAAAFEGQPEAVVRCSAEALGAVCRAVGLDVVCAPVLDLRVPGAHDVIGDRAFSADPREVARLGRGFVAGLRDAGCVPVIKHIPGHGRAAADSHHALPVVTADVATLADDLVPFQALAQAPALAPVWAMTAHILYPAWDAAHCATFSSTIITRVIRGQIGFDGVLISDDLAMGALSGPADEAAGTAIAAGCDLVLHCTGILAETAALLRGCPTLSARGQDRLDASRAGTAWRGVAPKARPERGDPTEARPE